MESIIRIILGLIGLAALIFVGLLVYGTLTDYQPDPIEEAEMHRATQASAGAQPDSIISLMIWNIGYAGLGAEQDFFLDGGKSVQPSREQNERYLQGISQHLAKQRDVDFILLQEVDRDAKRSYGTDQAVHFSGILPEHHWAFASNFKVKFIPVPFDPFPFVRPIGRVHGGLASFSKLEPSSAKRYDFPGSYGWPKRLFHLDRCFLEMRFPLQNGKELIVINSHNSAYDGGVLKAGEMAMLKDYLLEQYQAGHYIIVGADWNQCPPDFDPKTFKKDEDEYDQQNIEADYLSGWTWAYDASIPTNRKVARPYDANTSFTTVIDFFLVSPNVELERVRGEKLDFAWSDHQPVHLSVRLR